MTKLNLVAAAALGAVLLTSAPALAETTVNVPTGEFNLLEAKDQRALDARLRVAVRDVCGVTPPVRDLREVRDHRQCVTDARASILDQRDAAIAQAKAQDATRMAIAERKATEG
ncbi:MAG: UrcA family protein [Pseudomonadota bacterium]